MEKILNELGFSEYKKRTYLAIIKLEKAKVGQIAKSANIPSSKIYEILRWLYENGYISIVSQKPLMYKANDPKSILKSEVSSKIDVLKKIENEINNLNTHLDVAEKANFQIVYGRDAFFKKVKEVVSKSDKSIIAIVKNWRLDYELKILTKEFVKKGGKGRFLGPIKKENKNLIKEWNETGIKTKNFNPDTTRFTIWDERIITIGFKEENKKDYFSLWIENEYLGKILTDYFNKLWNEAI